VNAAGNSEYKPMTETKKDITSYLDNLIVEAAKNDTGNYSSLINGRSIPPSELKNARNKVLQGEFDYYSREFFERINSEEQIEEKRVRVVNAVLYYVDHLKGGSGQPDEAKQILSSFAELLKEEIVSETRVTFTDWPSECQNKLKIKDETAPRSLAKSKHEILEFIGNNNDIGRGSETKESRTDDGSANDKSKTEPSIDEEKNDYVTTLENTRTELASVTKKIKGTSVFDEALENDFQRLDELFTKTRELISQKAKAEGGEFNDSLVREITAPARTAEFLNKKMDLLSQASECYIKKVEAKMQELGYDDEEINRLIHIHGIEKMLD
jgi:hypothetical protein